jgi:hypothetical protein
MFVFGQSLFGIECPGQVAPAQGQSRDAETDDAHAGDYGRESRISVML